MFVTNEPHIWSWFWHAYNWQNIPSIIRILGNWSLQVIFFQPLQWSLTIRKAHWQNWPCPLWKLFWMSRLFKDSREPHERPPWNHQYSLKVSPQYHCQYQMVLLKTTVPHKYDCLKIKTTFLVALVVRFHCNGELWKMHTLIQIGPPCGQTTLMNKTSCKWGFYIQMKLRNNSCSRCCSLKALRVWDQSQGNNIVLILKWLYFWRGYLFWGGLKAKIHFITIQGQCRRTCANCNGKSKKSKSCTLVKLCARFKARWMPHKRTNKHFAKDWSAYNAFHTLRGVWKIICQLLVHVNCFKSKSCIDYSNPPVQKQQDSNKMIIMFNIIIYYLSFIVYS